jgi:hypothetical protein
LSSYLHHLRDLPLLSQFLYLLSPPELSTYTAWNKLYEALDVTRTKVNRKLVEMWASGEPLSRYMLLNSHYLCSYTGVDHCGCTMLPQVIPNLPTCSNEHVGSSGCQPSALPSLDGSSTGREGALDHSDKAYPGRWVFESLYASNFSWFMLLHRCRSSWICYAH